MFDKELDKILKRLNDKALKDAISILKLNGKFSSGKLIKSLKSKIIETADGPLSKIFFESYGLNIEEGRRPGTSPPLNKLIEWCKIQGIPTEAAYPIQQKIKEKGIKPVDWLKPINSQALKVKAELEKILPKIIESEIIK